MNFLFQLHPADRPYLPHLKGVLGSHSVKINDSTPGTITEVEVRAKQAGTTKVLVSNQKLLSRLLRRQDDRKQPTLDDFSGSIIERDGFEYLILNPVEHLVSVPYGKFLYERYISKFTDPHRWFPIPNFSWEIARPDSLPRLYAAFQSADFIGIDIETVETELSITCSGYCGIWIDRLTNRIRFHSVVIPCTSEFELAWIAKFNSLPAPKIFQNGKYDNAYFARWGVPVTNWVWDTAHLFHSWYSELPKRLDFIVSFLVRNWQYWKDESKVPIGTEEYYRYNAKDAFTTALAFMCALAEMPEWARQNYLMEFPTVFPCHLAELTGLKVHAGNFQQLRDFVEERISNTLGDLRASLGEPNFNPNSPPQCVRLWKVLGSSDITSSTTADRDKIKNRHPLNQFVIDKIEFIRKDRKLLSSYLKDSAVWNGRIFYQLNPHGTDTGRLASKESHFWCGLQIHNTPVDRKEISFKTVYAADEGFLMGEADEEKAESWDMAHITGDEGMLSALNSGKDFHGINASLFFGIPYEKIVAPDGRVLDEDIRYLSKRTNHGANYNMQWKILLDTMGIQNVLRARELLRLPKSWTLRQVTEYLLGCFDKAYPVIRGEYHDWIKYNVPTTNKLVGATGWTRYCFGNPKTVRHYLSAYAAHNPQSLNAMRLNKMWMRIFHEVYLPNPKDFKLNAQIHDSILFQYRMGREDLVRLVYAKMLMDTTVTDIRGKVRTYTVPVAMKAEGKTWKEMKKVKLELEQKEGVLV